MGITERIRAIVRDEFEKLRKESVSNRYKIVKVDGILSPAPSKCYVVPIDNEDTIPEKVVNVRTKITENLGVIVGVDSTTNVRQVLRADDSEIYDQDDYTGQAFDVQAHAPDHQWTSQQQPPFNNPAIDAVSVGQRGLLPLRARPASAGGTKIDIEPFSYEFNSTWKEYPGASSYDLSSNVPSTSGKQIFTLVYLNKTTNTLSTADSVESIYAQSVRPQFPTLPSGKIEPIALIRLYNGQTAISELYDIYDVRRVIGTAESDNANIPFRVAGAVSTGGSAVQPTSDNNVTVDNDIHHRGEMLIGGDNGTEPAAQLHVIVGDGTLPSISASGKGAIVQNNDDTSDQARLYLIAGNAGFCILEFGDTDNSARGYVAYDHSNDDMWLGTSGNTRLIIKSNGDVGVGTTSPDTRLDISDGAIEFEEMTAPGAGAANTTRMYTKDNGSGKTQIAVQFATGSEIVLATEA